jgi:serine/threonine protein kinase
MIAGIDPFNSEDPASLYQNILEHNLRFPINFDRFIFYNRDAKSLVNHLLNTDVNKRYGAMKRGILDVKNHRWFE